jgi:hypothetical protein
MAPDILERHIERVGYGLLNATALHGAVQETADGTLLNANFLRYTPVLYPVYGQQTPDVGKAVCVFW